MHFRRRRAISGTSHGAHWTRHLVYRSEHLRTTWKLRLGTLGVVGLVLWLTTGWWTVAIGRSLVCDGRHGPSDAILVENFDLDYLLFERAAELRRAAVAPRVFVPVQAYPGTSRPNRVALENTQVMATIAHLGAIEVIPVHVAEPISLNASLDVRRFIEREEVRSLTVVAPLFRSRRSALVYTATLGDAGVTVTCEPVQAAFGVDSWTQSWHGIQQVVEQWIKLQYYRMYVLPLRGRSAGPSGEARSTGSSCPGAGSSVPGEGT
jgi:hypothetical protein